MAYSVGIYIFDNVEVLDFAGPYEVFTTASRVFNKTASSLAHPPFEVFTIGKTKQSIYARAGLKLHPDYSMTTHPSLDLLIIPGGVVTKELEDDDVIAWIKSTASSTPITASICTGAFLLAKAGLLEGKASTTHWEDIDELHALFPSLHVKENMRWVDEGSIVTSAGISAGIDMSLHLVERLMGKELAVNTARQMEFDWTQNG
ncbi:DJ-1/PfpI family protein [Sulfurospirillum halorespirans]|uniref:ThiJ/PfpI family protein n=1 Tax=Sulfurospirillum halorespirans DSM 13726 TaxID=1193502 RepID=A0A1D7TN89_9BACT|nr:DJ-1/PfpI family protein [Sulfurospirillum halorespirans]AOO66466.1 ThiJ/PfpI family protein [Sulfurospirillum halorespirans DSM 13726]